jgi:hypothetical protein
MARWSIRNYNAFIREARKKADLTQGQARNVYRAMAASLKRPANGKDVKAHPRIFGRASRTATGAVVKVTRVSLGGDGLGSPRATAPSGGTTINSMRSWEDRLDDYDDLSQYDYDEYESSANYGEV